MRLAISISVLAFFSFRCSSPNPDQLDSALRTSITGEVKAVADSIWSKWAQLDPRTALQYYADSPDWLSINSQGSVHDLEAYKKLAVSFKNSATSYKWITIRQEFNVLTNDIVICNWIGKDDVSWISGDHSTCVPHAYTLIFRKLSNQWKLIYSHDSGVWSNQKSRQR